jgi:hypothetical protein
MKPFRNKGWRWLRYMERILPKAGATGAYLYAPTEANPLYQDQVIKPENFRDTQLVSGPEAFS